VNDKPLVLVVDDDDAMAATIVEALRAGGLPAAAAQSAHSALQSLEKQEAAVLVADVFLKGLNGQELVKQTAARSPATQVVLIGRDVPTYTVVAAMKEGAFDFIEKPLEPDHLLLVVRKALEHHRLQHENQALRRVYDLHTQRQDGFVAASPAMSSVLETIELVAPSELTVLVTGESGVGKELVANRIHARSRRGDRPFIAVNCGAIQETLLESELFGHVKGAFTGAIQDRQGLFEVADHGTLFLDEIGEMNLDLQVKLLRVLESSEFRRVGGTKLVHVDVRVVAATNKRLTDEVAAGRFREDLFYRLNVIHIEVPPLRERQEDIPAIVAAFLDAHHRKGLPRRAIAPEALAALQTYPWPGNVRELRNVIERSLILARGDVISVGDLPPTVAARAGASTAGALDPAGGPPLVVPDYDVRVPLGEVERRHILRVLAAHDGNKVRTARALGINVKTLYNKIKIYEEEGLLDAEVPAPTANDMVATRRIPRRAKKDEAPT
jgi:DNA-binding NtrC family response regulator